MIPPGITSRRADVDTLRTLALAALIIYHVLLIYSGREFWRLTSSYNGYWADYLLGVLTPWRMALVFVVGGIAVRFMMERAKLGEFIAERTSKLMVAFVFAVVVLIPPQRYIRLDELGQFRGQSYAHYAIDDAPFVVHQWGLNMPDLAHAWFLPYLFVYSVAAALIWRFAPKLVAAAQRAVEQMPIAALAGVVCLQLAIAAAWIEPQVGPSRVLLADLTAHVRFVPLFLLGALIGKSSVFLNKLDRAKTWLWALAACALIASLGLQWIVLHSAEPPTGAWLAVRGAFGALMLFSMLAFGHWALNRSSPFLSWASDAILPVYLMHQTVLVIVGDMIIRKRFGLLLESALLLGSALIIPVALYQVFVRYVPPMRVLFGLRPRLRKLYDASSRQAHTARPAARAHPTA